MFTCSCSSQNIYTHVQFVNFMKALALDGFEKIKWLNERILNECKDCVGAWVLQITGTGVGTLSETGYTPNPIFAYPTLLNKHLKGLEGESY